jgi:hypothetical protein
MWTRQNRKASSLKVAHDMGAAQDLYILKIAFVRLHFTKLAQREGHGDERRFFGDQPLVPEDPYRGWDDFFAILMDRENLDRMHCEDDTYSLQSYAWRLRMFRTLPIGGLGTAGRMRYVTDFRHTNRLVQAPPRSYRPPGLPYTYEPPDVLQHGREYSSDEEGDGPGLEKRIFLESWPFVAVWIKQNRRYMLAEEMCKKQYLHLLRVAFLRIHLMRVVQMQGPTDEEAADPEDPYRGWDEFFFWFRKE